MWKARTSLLSIAGRTGDEARRSRPTCRANQPGPNNDIVAFRFGEWHIINPRDLVAISAVALPHWRPAPDKTPPRASAMNEIGWRALMKLRRRDFLLFVTLTSAAAGPAFGQFAVGLASPGSNQSSGSIPALSGGWGHNFLLFEPPSAGPGPVVTKLHTPAGTLMFNAVGDYTNPILKPEAAEVVKRSAEKELSGVAIPNLKERSPGSAGVAVEV